MLRIIKEHRFIAACVTAAVILVLCFALGSFRTSEEDMARQADSVRDTILRRALQCYVIESAYPESLEYLEANYGLAVNKEDYLIVYTPYAENMPPDVRVIYKGKK